MSSTEDRDGRHHPISARVFLGGTIGFARLKRTVFFALLGCFAAEASEPARETYAEIKLTDGTILRDARVVSQGPARITFQVGSALKQVDKQLLPTELREKYSIPASTESAPVGSSEANAASAEEAFSEIGTREDRAKQALILEALHYGNSQTFLVYQQARNGLARGLEPQELRWRKLIGRFCLGMEEKDLVAQFRTAKESPTQLSLSNGGQAIVWRPPVMLMIVPVTDFGKIKGWRPSQQLHPLAVLFELDSDGRVAAWSVH